MFRNGRCALPRLGGFLELPGLFDDAEDVALFHDEQILAVDLDLGAGPLAEQHVSIGLSLPDSSRPPGPTATTSPCEGFSFAVSGMMMPPAVFSSAFDAPTHTINAVGGSSWNSSYLSASMSKGRRVKRLVRSAAKDNSASRLPKF
jgi:hypothetical protein